MVASLFMFGLASCGEDVGTVGDASVEFYTDNVEDGFGAGFVYVPIKMLGDATANVTLKVEPMEYTGEYAGTKDVDYSITTEDLVFKPGVDSINLEIRILNNDVDEMRIKLGITDSNADVGTLDQAMVVLTKSTRDRMCGDWIWSFDQYTSLTGSNDATAAQAFQGAKAHISWDAQYAEFNITGYETWWSVNSIPLLAGYDSASEKMLFTQGATGMYNTGVTATGEDVIYQTWFTGNLNFIAEEVYATCDDTFTNLTFSHPQAFLVLLGFVNGQPMYVFTQAYNGLHLTKASAAPTAPMSTAMNAAPKYVQIRYTNPLMKMHLTDYQRVQVEEMIKESLK